MKPNILIVDDEPSILRILELQLGHEGYTVFKAENGLEAVELVKRKKEANSNPANSADGTEEIANIELIIMDVMMPTLNGYEACALIKKIDPDIKIILLTALDDTQDLIKGLDTGADDYITKPFEFDELHARIRVQLRSVQKSAAAGDSVEFEDLKLDYLTFKAERAGEKIELSKTEFNLIDYMMRNNGIVLSRDQILENVWGYDYFGAPNVVDVYIKYLRDKIDRKHERKLIHTVRGRGYIVK